MRLPPTSLCLLLCFALPIFTRAEPLPGTQPLEKSGDLSAEMVAGIGRYLDREIAKAPAARLERWKGRGTKIFMSMELRGRLGMSDTPTSGGIEVVQPLGAQPAESREAGYRALHVHWPVFATNLHATTTAIVRPAVFARITVILATVQTI